MLIWSFLRRCRALGRGATVPMVLLVVAGCDFNFLQPGRELVVSAVTSGTDLDSDGYAVLIDRVEVDRVASNGTLNVTRLSVGNHSVAISDIASNCAETDSGPRLVHIAAGEVSTVSFAVSCVAFVGTLRVVTATDGLIPDTDGYVVIVGADTVALAPDDTSTFEVHTGTPAVELTGQAVNCIPHAFPWRRVSLVYGQTTSITLSVTCFEDPIVFVRAHPDGPRELYAIDAAGGAEVQLTGGSGSDDNVLAPAGQGSAISPDRTWVAFTCIATAADERYDYLRFAHTCNLALNKSAVHRRSPPGWWIAFWVSTPVWSPDGHHLLFVESYTSSTDVMLGNTDFTTIAYLIGSDSARDSEASWSADGTRILMTRDSAGFGTRPASAIWVVNADGSNAVNVSNGDGLRDQGLYDESGTWSPDGTHILFRRVERVAGGEAIGDLWVVDPDGNNLTRLTDTPEDEASAQWSPDGTRIYFTRCSGPCDGTGGDVWSMDATGANPTQITFTGHEEFGSWNATRTFAGTVPGGTHFVSVNRSGTPRLFIQAADGSGRKAITSDSAAAESPQWR